MKLIKNVLLSIIAFCFYSCVFYTDDGKPKCPELESYFEDQRLFAGNWRVEGYSVNGINAMDSIVKHNLNHSLTFKYSEDNKKFCEDYGNNLIVNRPVEDTISVYSWYGRWEYASNKWDYNSNINKTMYFGFSTNMWATQKINSGEIKQPLLYTKNYLVSRYLIKERIELNDTSSKQKIILVYEK